MCIVVYLDSTKAKEEHCDLPGSQQCQARVREYRRSQAASGQPVTLHTSAWESVHPNISRKAMYFLLKVKERLTWSWLDNTWHMQCHEEMGFSLFATKSTSDYLSKHGVSCSLVYKPTIKKVSCLTCLSKITFESLTRNTLPDACATCLRQVSFVFWFVSCRSARVEMWYRSQTCSPSCKPARWTWWSMSQIPWTPMEWPMASKCVGVPSKPVYHWSPTSKRPSSHVRPSTGSGCERAVVNLSGMCAHGRNMLRSSKGWIESNWITSSVI